jgi:hypothetical protein
METPIKKFKEYLFNTENHTDKESEFYISPAFLKQTLEILDLLEQEETFYIKNPLLFDCDIEKEDL